MANKVGIGIEAQLDTSAVEQRINAFGQRVAQANKVQFTPISVKALADLETARKRFEQLLKVHGELNRRVKATGQSGKSPWDMDFDSMFPVANSRAQQMRRVMEYTFGANFTQPPGQPGGGGRPPPPPPGGGGSGRPPAPNGPSWGGMGVNVAQAGLRAAGPAGGVAAGALGTGMSAGFGAGLMGLMGGMAALGLGKLVGSITEKIGQAEDNNVALDRLKRTLGDVNLSFNALKAVVHGGADSLKITYSEAGQLATQFSKLGNVTAEQSKTLSDELGIGVGLSRAYGLDPSQGVGIMGQMRGVGVTSSTQESRRFAMLIGETIGKSGAFAKADEVMEAIAGYAVMQTRQGMGAANVGGFAGMFAGMVGSGIPGLDPSGAGALLGRINASLTAGGAKGEASQFFTAMVGQRMGLDPFQTQILREGGAFATNDEAFGPGSVASRFGIGGPGGNKTFLQGSMEMLRQQYGGNKGLLAQATANHLGINMRQAMAMLSVDPSQMGEMERALKASGVDLTNMSGDGIGNVSAALFGSDGQRRALANSLAARRGAGAMSSADMGRLDSAMAGSDTALQKQILAELAAKYGQEQTQGSDIRDSKNSLDNIKTNLADKLVPYVNEMRHGIMFLAGRGGKMTSEDVMKTVINADADARIKGINGRYQNKIDAKEDEYRIARSEGLRTQNPELLEKAERIQKEINDLKDAQAKDIQKENDARKASIASIEESIKARSDLSALEREEAEKLKDSGGSGGAPRYGAAPSAGGGRGFVNPRGVVPASVDTSSIDAKLSEAERANGLPAGTLRAVIAQETGGRTSEFLSDPSKYHYGLDASGRRIAGHTGKVSTAFGPFGILESTGADPGYGVSPLKDKGIDEQIRFAAEYLAARSRSAGSLAGGLAGYGEGAGYSRSVMGRIGNTPLPADAGAGGGYSPSLRVTADDITVRVVDQNGMPKQAPQTITTRVSQATPFGASSN